ncbi:MAG: hypothetical protein COV48_09685 [Elusimicrobia bacterium CG11_big_fil_rev_8_21_14_0_20_64_6]|nr:MAG: hypothetical protein COV48_09685 [Elusimicrobia bacterium CG11_big_fil_rev_8_21_14_0_20_64_6]
MSERFQAFAHEREIGLQFSQLLSRALRRLALWSGSGRFIRGNGIAREKLDDWLGLDGACEKDRQKDAKGQEALF